MKRGAGSKNEFFAEDQTLVQAPITAFFRAQKADVVRQPAAKKGTGARQASRGGHTAGAVEGPHGGGDVWQLVQQLEAQWSEKQARLSAQLALERASDNSELIRLLQEAKELETVRKEKVFVQSLTEQEQELVRRRVELQQRAYQIHEQKEKQRKIRKICLVHPHVSATEAQYALEANGANEDLTINKLQDFDYLTKVRFGIAKGQPPSALNERPGECSSDEDDYELGNDGDGRRRARARAAPAPTAAAASAAAAATTAAAAAAAPRGDRTVTPAPRDSDREGAATTTPQSKRKQSVSQYKRFRLPLNEALAKDNFEGWSPARIRAWELRDTNPNAYYYRFLPPGERQREGPWSAEEKALFMARLKEMGANGQWGLFSMTIPGRVGYQCSNFYRLLIEHGEIHDPNYILDEKGKACYIKGRGRGRGRTAADSVAVAAAAAAPPAATRASQRRAAGTTSRKRTARDRSADDEEEEGSSDGPSEAEATSPRTCLHPRKRVMAARSTAGGRRVRTAVGRAAAAAAAVAAPARPASATDSGTESAVVRAAAEAFAQTLADDSAAAVAVSATRKLILPDLDEVEGPDPDNPLPDFIDPITLERVVKPTMSPHGFVMGYDSWIRCLSQEPKNRCPWTKKTVNRRDLIPVTWENVEELRPRFANVD